jgi:hypothetical protein
MVGLPQTGKTTFLAALWHVLEEGGSAASLHLKRLQPDRTYLNRIRKSWQSCTTLERTTLHNEEYVTLLLEGKESGEIELTVPDLSGEAFELQVRERRWTVKYDTLVCGADGVLMFVHPDVIWKDPRVDEANRLAAQLGEDANSPEAVEQRSHVGHTPWSPNQLPTQVQLVDLLQFFVERRNRSLRVCFVISAWDLVEEMKQSPEALVETQLPLLWQYLKSNRQTIDYIIVGVSAQGGDIEKNRENLLKKETPLDRIRIVGIKAESYDITAPIAWSLV